jgi:hypothetical protein
MSYWAAPHPDLLRVIKEKLALFIYQFFNNSQTIP